jgi:hypothetical protein
MKMARGVPTAHSQRYKATPPDKINSIPPKEKITTISTSDSNVFPSLPLTPTTQAEGVQRAFATVTVLLQSLLLTASPDTHPHNLLQVIIPYFHDCSEWHRESEASNRTLQQQFDELNPKLLAQDLQILALEDQPTKSRTMTDFYRDQAATVD